MAASFSRTDRIVRGVLQRMDELPSLAGAQWPVLGWSLREQLASFAAAVDGELRDRSALEILALVLSGVRFSTEAWLTGGLVEAGRAPERGRDHLLQDRSLQDLLACFLRPAVIRCELGLTCPRALRVGERTTAVLTFLPARGGGEGEEPSTELDARIPVRVRAQGVGLTAYPSAQELRLDPRALPCVLEIELAGLRPGPGLLIVEISQGRALLKVLRAEVDIGAQQGAGEDRGRFPFEAGGIQAPQPDLVIRTDLEGRELRIRMEFDNSEGHATEGRLNLRSDPVRCWGRWRAELEKLGRSATPREDLESFGSFLYQELWPESLRPTLQWLMEGSLRSVQVVSSDEWLIPWELLRPYSRGGSAKPKEQEEEFLGERFDLARWCLSNRSTRPRSEITLRHVTCVIPYFEDLPGTRVEAAVIARETARRSLLLTQVEPPDKQNTLRALSSRQRPVDIWHFASHGDHSFAAPDHSPLWLEGRSCIQPKDLIKAERKLWAERPFVFLNACRVGHGGVGLTTTGGWPRRLVGDCGIGALLSPLYSVSDRVATAFAQAFYEHLPGAGTDDAPVLLAPLVCSLRKILRESFPDDPSWLAYALFADPNAKLSLG